METLCIYNRQQSWHRSRDGRLMMNLLWMMLKMALSRSTDCFLYSFIPCIHFSWNNLKTKQNSFLKPTRVSISYRIVLLRLKGLVKKRTRIFIHSHWSFNFLISSWNPLISSSASDRLISSSIKVLQASSSLFMNLWYLSPFLHLVT